MSLHHLCSALSPTPLNGPLPPPPWWAPSSDGNSLKHFHGCAYDANAEVLQNHETHYGNEARMG